MTNISSGVLQKCLPATNIQCSSKELYTHFQNLIYIISTPVPTLYFWCIKRRYMSALYILISVSFLVAVGFLAAFIWSIKSGQYEDDYAPGVRILKENHKPKQ